MTVQSILRPRNGQTVSFDDTAGGEKNTTAFASPQIGLYADQACYIKLGDSDVTVSAEDYDMKLQAGTMTSMETGGYKYIAVLQVTASGTLDINEWTHRND